MGSPHDIESFIGSSFRSVWALELLLLLKREARSCPAQELVAMMRASPAVIERALASLVAAGLADHDADGASFMPVSDDIALLVDETERMYHSRPDRVRRLIVASSNKGITAFSDAFRLKD